MATIQIKRSANIAAPTTTDLVEGELAYSYDKSNSGAGAKLYIEVQDSGGAESIHTIGGKYYTDIVDAATSSNTPNALVKRDGSGNFSANIVTANNFVGSFPNSGVTAGTYGGSSAIPVVTIGADGRVTSASNSSISGFVTADSITTFTNKTFDVSVAANNIFSIQGQSITSYTGSGSSVVLSQSPTISVLNISDSQINLDGGSGTYYWGGQSGVAQTGDLKAGVYASDPSSNNSLFTFGTNGSNKMSVGVEGSLFVGTAMPSNNGGLSTAYSGWLVVQSGGKFGGDIDTLGGLNLTDATSGKIQFSDGSIQRTAYTSNHLTTANVVEVTNLYFTNARSRAALTSGNNIAYDSATGNITLLPSGVSANTYGGTVSIPVISVDAYGRITSAANTSISTTLAITDGQTDGSVPLATGKLGFNGNDGISTSVSGNTVSFTLTTTGATAGVYGGPSTQAVLNVDTYGRVVSISNVTTEIALGTNTTGAYVANLVAGTGISLSGLGNEGTTPTITNSGVTSAASGGYGLTVSAATGAVTFTNTGVTRIIASTGIGADVDTGNVTLTNLGVTSLTGTANEITVSSANGSVTVGLPDDVSITRDLSIGGNLYVTGNVVSLPVENLVVEDSLIQLANNNSSSDVIDIGFYGSYGPQVGGVDKHAGLFRDASDGKFKLFQGLLGSGNITSTVDISAAGYSLATLNADLLASNANVYTALTFGGDQHKIIPLTSDVLEVRGGLGSATGALSLAAGNYPTAYSKIYLESGKKITAQADEFYVTLFNDGNTKLITMNTTHTAAISTSTGALRVSGGVGITGNLYANYINGTIDGGTY